MPWILEMFSAAALDRVRARKLSENRTPVPYFDGLLSGDTAALIRSFAGEPELHHPVRGRVKGARAFERFVADQAAWLTGRHATIVPVDLIVTPHRSVEEVELHPEGPEGHVELPVAIAVDRDDRGRIRELRV